MAPKSGFYKCCNPLQLKNHTVKKGLRLASKRLQDLWNLRRFHYLCASCRKTMNCLKSISSSLNHSSSESDMRADECDNEGNDILVAESDDILDVNNAVAGSSNTKTESFLTTASISSLNSFSSGLIFFI